MSDITERVERIKAEYPRYNRSYDAAVRNPQTGVVLTARAKELANGGKPKVSVKYKVLSVRIERDFADLNGLEKKLKVCGYGTMTNWIRACIKRLNCEYAAKQKNTARNSETA